MVMVTVPAADWLFVHTTAPTEDVVKEVVDEADEMRAEVGDEDDVGRELEELVVGSVEREVVVGVPPELGARTIKPTPTATSNTSTAAAPTLLEIPREDIVDTTGPGMLRIFQSHRTSED
jgi:hypothetical protein